MNGLPFAGRCRAQDKNPREEKEDIGNNSGKQKSVLDFIFNFFC